MIKIARLIGLTAIASVQAAEAEPLIIMPTSQEQLRDGELNDASPSANWAITDLRSVEEKTQKILKYRIPKIEFSEDPMHDVLDYLSLSAMEMYSQVEERFVPFQISADEDIRNALFSLSGREMRISEVIDLLCEKFSLRSEVYGYQVLLKKRVEVVE